MVNVRLLKLVEDIKQILKMFVVHPKNVNAEIAAILPVMLSSKLLPEMEQEEAALKEQILAGVSNLPIQLQTEKLQKQIGMVNKACEIAEKALTDTRKIYGLGSRQIPVLNPPLDKAQVAKIAEQEKLLRSAVNVGEGLRLLPNERQQPVSLPQHLVEALQSSDGGSSYQNTGASKGVALQPSVTAHVSTPQQVAAAQILNRNVPSPVPMLGSTPLDGTTASPMFANSPRSGNTIMAEASPQQQQQSILQRQKVQQMQKQQQLQQQQQQLRQPGTAQIGQAHFQQLQHQAQLQLQAQERHHLQLQLQQQRLQHQQQLQSGSLQPGQQLQQSLGQNHLAQSGQLKPHLGSIGASAAGGLFGNAQISSNMMPNAGANMQPQAAMLQQRLHLSAVGMGATGQPQRTLPSQLLTDPRTQSAAANLGLPLQQQLVGGQSNFNSMLNPNQTINFGQQRQPPPQQ
ncbi:hypothetical protein KP509_22G053100 [Ceratopteris richardii]|nr:hypothetical protein KP509_22G053100 [Ceratopteris richardii]